MTKLRYTDTMQPNPLYDPSGKRFAGAMPRRPAAPQQAPTDGGFKPPAPYAPQPPASAPFRPGMATPVPPADFGTPYGYPQSPYGHPQGYGSQQGKPFVPPGFDKAPQDPIVAQNEADSYRRQQDRIAQGRFAPGDPGYVNRDEETRNAALAQARQQYRDYLERERQQNEENVERQRQQAMQPTPGPAAVWRELVPTGGGFAPSPLWQLQQRLPPAGARQSPVSRYFA